MRDVSVISLRCYDHWLCSNLNSIAVVVDVVTAASSAFQASAFYRFGPLIAFSTGHQQRSSYRWRRTGGPHPQSNQASAQWSAPLYHQGKSSPDSCWCFQCLYDSDLNCAGGASAVTDAGSGAWPCSLTTVRAEVDSRRTGCGSEVSSYSLASCYCCQSCCWSVRTIPPPWPSDQRDKVQLRDHAEMNS